ncbi:hybrid sensor histidine kinase/response regulator [Marinobacter xestospongiae]|uniref:hybrid sensor histidine kinase/response regulator n=1 Tax=Marinobacter xestospongiae TaxID=994319 RepID=UPI0020038BC6|nr:ATP-binding protein [Marinobacter xestospongiae]MCK7568110.1 ATP-binding protein [Marinobacter xestospongiae]
MHTRQNIFRVRRRYNQWVANQTLEDYALRFTAKGARHWSGRRVVNTALGAISFLALEAIGGAITLSFGFTNALAATLVVGAIIFLVALPISYYAARDGVDIDLLTRGAGFGYIGSTLTSLIYASFTFLFFAIEAAIMAMVLERVAGVPLTVGYLLCSLVIIPLVTHGIRTISRFQLWTQPLWLGLQLLPFIAIAVVAPDSLGQWQDFQGRASSEGDEFNLLLFGAASAVVFSLMAQIGEQVDFLRFLPAPAAGQRGRWWSWVVLGGPGWIVIGVLKILAGSFLVTVALGHGLADDDASNPVTMYQVAFGYLVPSPAVALALTGLFVVLCQLKINVTNAYAGSIAWSNFFSRLTHSHPGRVVWLVFNVAIALLVMELGIYRALEATLGFYGLVAVAWVGALAADLVINKPLGLSPRYIEFKRAHLYDINPVGVGSMTLASVTGMLCYAGALGNTAQALAHFLTLATALAAAPTLAWLTKGRYYIARPWQAIDSGGQRIPCSICQHRFEPEDITHCPAYGGTICSLCCTLDARCGDGCKPGAGYRDQLRHWFGDWLPAAWQPHLRTRVSRFLTLMVLINGACGLLLTLIYHHTTVTSATEQLLMSSTLWQVFSVLIIITGVVCWLFVLAQESRRVAEEESHRQTRLLMAEIAAHEKTDQALQQAKEHAEAANDAKSRYLTGISHELRSPLNAILGYAQLLEHDRSIPEHRREALSVMRRSSEYLADLIEGLLDISKIEAGRLELHRGPVQLELLMTQLVHLFRLQAETKGLAFHYHGPSRLPAVVTGDEKRLRQILINLLSNAIKYTDHGEVSLTVRYRNQVAEFTVHDTGEGIAADNLERIFHPFERIRTPGVSRTGTGLGLTITRLLTDIMGGDIQVDSEPGQGSCFRVSLMLASQTPVASPVPQPPADIVGYHGRRRRLLVVDDDPSHRQLMVAMLSPLGFEVRGEANPWRVPGQLASFHPDLVLLDVAMPGQSGWQVLATLRQNTPTLPVVMVSADAQEGQDQPERHDGYLLKPVRLDALLALLALRLDLHWQTRTVNAPQEPSTAAAPIAATLTPEQRRTLAELVAIGHRKGLQQTLLTLREQGVLADAAANRLIALAGDCRFDDLLTELEESHESEC